TLFEGTRQVKFTPKRIVEKRTLPRLCYVCRWQGYLAYSCPEQVKREGQELVIDVQSMKIKERSKRIRTANGEINSIEDVDETSNDEDGLKDDLEMKMGINNDVVDDEIMTRRGLNYAKLIGDDNEAKSGGNRLKMRKS
ncbi:13820_t:CDS:2, partial [Dentiscutata erythropus]